MDQCGSGGLPIHHPDRPDIYFPDESNDKMNNIRFKLPKLRCFRRKTQTFNEFCTYCQLISILKPQGFSLNVKKIAYIA